MVRNLFAACRVAGDLVSKRVRLNEEVQQDVTSLFEQQEQEFRSGVLHEVPFTGEWKPDEDEVLTIDAPVEAKMMVGTVRANAISVDEVDTRAFSDEGIKALFIGSASEGTVLVQRFTAQQLLERKFSLHLAGNAFRRLSGPAFTMDTSLACIVEGEKVKFKSHHKIRSIIDMTEIYREATEEEVNEFARHARFEVGDVASFVRSADQTSRKLIHAIAASGVLEEYDAERIGKAAASTNLSLSLRNGRIVMPGDRKGIKDTLQFLNEGRFAGPISGLAYVTNSRKRV